MRLGKRTARLVREAAVLGYVNGVWSTDKGFEAAIPSDVAVFGGVIRVARTLPELYPSLSRAELPEGDPAAAWIAAQEAEWRAAVRALINERSG